MNDDGDAYNYDDIDPTEAGDELADLLINAKVSGKMNATQVCTIAFWAVKSGSVGAITQLAYRPDAQSGKFSAHFDRVTRGADDDSCIYMLPTPRYNRSTAVRESVNSSTLVAHEALVEEFSSADMPGKLHDAMASNELPPTYFTHDVVASAPIGTPVYPIVLYMDGVHIKRRDNCVGFWVYCTLTKTRHCLAPVRKCTFCRCGCNGWCTLYGIFQQLRWSLEALAEGVWPTCRHDGSPFSDELGDGFRRELAGTQFGFRCACLGPRGDWAEYAHTLGLPTWRSLISPCPICHVPHDHMHDFTGMTALEPAYPLKTQDDYDNACDLCEQRVTIESHAELRIIRSHLKYDRRNAGGHGRCLDANLPQFGVQAGDRLEPSPQLPDVGAFDQITRFPVSVIFWRRSLNTITLHRNPVFSERLGITHQTLTCDSLHILSLGIFGFFIAFVLHRLIEVDAWQTHIAGGTDGRIAQSVLALRAELFTWYGAERSRGIEHTQLDDLVPTMIGTRRQPDMHTQGAETNSLLMFLPVLLDRHQHKLVDGARVRIACDCLVRMRILMREHRHVFPGHAMQAFYNATRRFLTINREIGGPEKPKHHMLCHLALNIRDHGSPTSYATWDDEDHNGKLKKLGINAHTSVWEKRVILDWRAHYGSGRGDRRTRARH